MPGRGWCSGPPPPRGSGGRAERMKPSASRSRTRAPLATRCTGAARGGRHQHCHRAMSDRSTGGMAKGTRHVDALAGSAAATLWRGGGRWCSRHRSPSSRALAEQKPLPHHAGREGAGWRRWGAGGGWEVIRRYQYQHHDQQRRERRRAVSVSVFRIVGGSGVARGHRRRRRHHDSTHPRIRLHAYTWGSKQERAEHALHWVGRAVWAVDRLGG